MRVIFTNPEGDEFHGFLEKTKPTEDGLPYTCEGAVIFGACDTSEETGKLADATWEFNTGPDDTFPLWFCESCKNKFIRPIVGKG